jgi:hypothetical protein
MRFEVKIKCDNAAFEDAPASEVARILRELAERIAPPSVLYGDSPVTLRDVHGNTVGHARFIGMGAR